MNTSSDERNPVELLAEDFLDRKRHGEQPTLREYLERHPDLAAEIRDLFPALLMMEDLGESSGGTTGSLAADGPAVGIPLPRLGHYRILREIGRGGMGVVYEAEQESLGRRAAVKVLPAGSLLDPKQVRRFEREAKAAARLHHTNIVPVFGVGRQDGHHYFVMQFIAGLGLDMVLDDLRRLRLAKSGEAGRAPRPASSRIAGLTGADVARSLIAGRFVQRYRCAGRRVGDRALRRRGFRRLADCRESRPGRRRVFLVAPAGLVRAVGVVRPRPPVLPLDRPHRHPGSRSIGIRQPPGNLASRCEAVEPTFGQPRQRVGGRLRAGKDGGSRRPDAHRRHPGHHPLHGAGAVRGTLRCPIGRLQPRIDAL